MVNKVDYADEIGLEASEWAYSFWARVNKNDPSGCWIWTTSYNRKKSPDSPITYGFMYPGKRADGKQRSILAHRFSYILHYGSIPEESRVLHKCDNRKCVNPEHLFLGTMSDNMKDMHSKNRHHGKGFSGHTHSDEAKAKMKQSYQER